MGPQPPIQFIWYVHEGGYRWVEGRDLVSFQSLEGAPPLDESESFLVPAVGLQSGAQIRQRGYLPPDNFFLAVGDVDTSSKEAIKLFADEYGLIGQHKETVLPKSPRPFVGYPSPSDRLGTWRNFVAEIREAVDFQRRIQEAKRLGNSAPLEDLIHWDGQGVRYERASRAGGVIIADSKVNPENLSRFRPGDLIAPAEHYFQSIVNGHLHGELSGQLLWLPPEPQTEPRLGLFFQPADLGAFLWLQLAAAVDAGKKIRQCVECGKWLVMAPKAEVGQRISRLTCSNRCRMKVYLKRKAEAVRLHQQGKAVPEIARELEAESASVKAWLSEGKTKARKRNK